MTTEPNSFLTVSSKEAALLFQTATNLQLQFLFRFYSYVLQKSAFCETKVVYHLHGETGWSMVCANGKQNSHIGNFRLGWRVPFEQQTQLTERA